ncbi:MAG: site-specific integrase [Mycobacteriales bacterium]
MSRREFGSVRQVSARRWQARYTDRNGRTRSRMLASRKEALQHLAEVQADLARGRWSDHELAQVRFGPYAQEWMAARVDLKPTTAQSYAYTLRRHLIPELGGYPMEELTAPRVRSWYARMALTTAVTPTRQAYALLRTICNTAVDDEVLLRNPCRIRGAGVPRSAERPIATLAQVDELAEAVLPRYRALVLMAAWTGARWGELIALTRDRLDLDVGRIRIDRQYVLLNTVAPGRDRLVLQTPKTAAGRRTVHLPPHLVPLLAAHLLEHVPPGCPLIFPNTKGEPIQRDAFAKGWDRARIRAGLPGFHFHDLRHTGNTLAATTGASTKELMARMGHASMRAAVLYQHATSERDREIAVALSALAQRQRTPSSSVVQLFSAIPSHAESLVAGT